MAILYLKDFAVKYLHLSNIKPKPDIPTWFLNFNPLKIFCILTFSPSYSVFFLQSSSFK